MEQPVKVSRTLQGISGARDVYAYVGEFYSHLRHFIPGKLNGPTGALTRALVWLQALWSLQQLSSCLFTRTQTLCRSCVSHCCPWCSSTLINDFMWTTELNLISLTTAEAQSLPQVLTPTCQHLHSGSNTTPMFCQLNLATAFRKAAHLSKHRATWYVLPYLEHPYGHSMPFQEISHDTRCFYLGNWIKPYFSEVDSHPKCQFYLH